MNKENEFVVAFDIDGTITQYQEYIIENGTKFFNKKPVNINGYTVSEVFDVSKEEENMFWNEYDVCYLTNAKRRKEVFKALKIVYEMNNVKVIYITDRYGFSLDLDRLKAITGSYIRKTIMDLESQIAKYKWNNSQQNIFFSQGDKLTVCKEQGVDIMIEEGPDPIKYLSEGGIKVIKIRTNYNNYQIGNTDFIFPVHPTNAGAMIPRIVESIINKED